MYTFVETVDPSEFNKFVSQHKHCNLLQSAQWAKVKANWGHHLTGLVDPSGALVGTGLVLSRQMPFGQSMWYLPKGPVLDYSDELVRKSYLEGLAAFAKRSRATVVKIDPPINRRSLPLSDYPGEVDPVSDKLIQSIDALGYKHQGLSLEMESTIQPRFSAVTYHRDDFVAGLSTRTRRIIRETDDYQVSVDREGRSSLADFAELIRLTEQSNEVSLRDQAYFEAIWDAFGDDNIYLYIARIDLNASLQAAEKDLAEVVLELERLPADATRKRPQLDKQHRTLSERVDFLRERLEADGTNQLVAGALVVEFGSTAELLYAGRNPHFSRIHAQDAIHVLAMDSAFKRGIQSFSTGGVPGTLDDGLAMFKSRFLAHFVETVGEFDLPVKPLQYKVLQQAIRIYRKIQNR